jgi:hypothetical protein
VSSDPLHRQSGKPFVSNATISPTYGCRPLSGWPFVIAIAPLAPSSSAASEAVTITALRNRDI